MTAPTDRDRETAFDIVATVECSIHSLATEQVVPLRDDIAAALAAAREEERERLAAIVPGSICDVIGDCVCPEGFRNPDCAPCAVANAIRTMGAA